ncbi:hypothetical protein F2Q68_00035464 [Brassica cretica]|uniref:No apical meristem-associated C-terminal domain-containing protein n=1 Tax=Brassica cretica TaxID=69181 RepID=A0A8S9HAN1_BRACR|nr:hypothetical protein F2Q68_00035464 [Brassica cretica]
MNDNEVLKLAHEIYFNNQQKKFSLEHAWNELRDDQKWCELATSKSESSSKKRKLADDSHSGARSQVNECDAGVEGTSCPPGVKAASSWKEAASLWARCTGKDEATLERSITGHCDYKVMGPLITIKATYHVPFQTNTIRGIGSNACSRYHIAVEDSSITGHSIISVCHGWYQFVSVSSFVSVCHGFHLLLMWSIKKDDLAMKQQLSKMRLLEKLLAKENLADYEEDLKKKLINELM